MAPATRRWLIVIVAVGALLRVHAIWFGLPYPQARPDEETAIGKAVDIARGDLNPHFFHWPSLTFYLFAGVLRAAQVVHDLFAPVRDFTFSERALLTRASVALAGTFTILVLFRLSRRIAGDRIALLASGFLAVAVLHVRESHFATTDTLATVFVWLSLAFLVHALDAVPLNSLGVIPSSASPLLLGVASGFSRKITLFALAGLTAGLATSTKYSAAAVALSIVAAQMMLFARAQRAALSLRGWMPSAVYVAAMLVGFCLASPYALFDRATFSRDVLFDLDHLAEGHRGIVLGRGWAYHGTHSLPYGVGVPVFIAAVAGAVPFVWHYPRAAFVLGAFAVPFYVVIGSGYTVFFRYVLPLVPLVCLLAAVGVEHVASAVHRRVASAFRRKNPAVFIAAALAAATLVPSLVQSVRFDLVLARTDTRVLAGRWLEQRIRPDDILYDDGNSYTRLDLWRVPVKRTEYDASRGGFVGVRPDWLVLHESPLWTYASTSPALGTLADTDYVLVHEERSTIGAAASGMYDLQDAFFVPLSGFSTIARPGPSIFIYRDRLSR